MRLASRDELEIAVRESSPERDDVLFVGRDQLRLLREIVSRLGGALRQEDGFGCPSRTYPMIRHIEFLDEDRTRAVAAVTLGGAGATVVLEKRDGEWEVVELTDFWIG